jgi:hypothetical protein
MKLFRLTILIVLFLLISVICINVLINPYGFYGNKQLLVNTFSLNLYKFYHLKEERIKSQAIIYGSSNTLSMDPELIQEKTGLKTYNYGVFQFTVEDLYCSVHALYENNIRPKLIILCIDDWALAKRASPKDEVFKGAQNRLAYKPELSTYLPDYSSLKLNWCRLKSSISADQLFLSFPEFIHRIRTGDFMPLSDSTLMEFFHENGTRKKFSNVDNLDITQVAEQGKYDVELFLKTRHEELKKYPDKPKGLVTVGQEIFKDFSEQRLNLLESILQFLNAQHCKVIINIMPLQPYYQQLIKENTNYDERIYKLTSLCATFKKKYPNIIAFQDNHDIRNFGGDKNHFFDENHLTSVNSALILRSLMKNIPADAF